MTDSIQLYQSPSPLTPDEQAMYGWFLVRLRRWLDLAPATGLQDGWYTTAQFLGPIFSSLTENASLTLPMILQTPTRFFSLLGLRPGDHDDACAIIEFRRDRLVSLEELAAILDWWYSDLFRADANETAWLKDPQDGQIYPSPFAEADTDDYPETHRDTE